MAKTRDEINRYIHERIRGLCWYDVIEGQCQKCPAESDDWAALQNPDYCSDSSPRSLLNEVVAVVDLDILNGILTNKHVPYLRCAGVFVRLPAEQIARACVEAWEAREDGK